LYNKNTYHKGVIMNFTKMQGTGNDFIMINGFMEHIEEQAYSSLAKQLCDRHFGVGADGIIIALPSQSQDIQMRIFNADGSEAEMCGNGIRCFALFVKTEGLLTQNTFNVETLAGKIVPEIMDFPTENSALVKVNMGFPLLSPQDIPTTLSDKESLTKQSMIINGETIEFTPVGMGNPHCVIFTDNITDKMVHTLGPVIENKVDIFPKKTNIEFIKIFSKEKIQMRVWERGSGETLACGTGACASVVAGILNGYLSNEVVVQLLGGELIINWSQNKPVLMTGEAKLVFTGKRIVY
jgi:diaminopimelate epimerase